MFSLSILAFSRKLPTLKPRQPGFGQKEKAQELQYKKQKGSLVSGAVTVMRVCVW